jgi:tetratricopeptide (TPR) repeat protein
VNWVAVGALACGLAGVAHADRADQLFKKGKRFLAEQRYAEACTAFEDSDRLDPTIGAKLNVAKCYQEWGKLATAWRWFTDAARMAKDARDDRASKIRALVAELDASVPRLSLKLSRDPAPTSVVVKLDGVELAAATIETERRVDPGPHEIEYILDGTRQRKTIPIERGATTELLLELPRKAATRRPRAVELAAEREDPGRPRRLAGLGVSAAGVVAVGVAGYLGLGARRDYRNALAANCRGASDMCDADGLAATRAARSRANLATVITIGGAVAAAGGLVLYFTARPGRRDEHAWYLAPSIDGDGAAAVVGGAF